MTTTTNEPEIVTNRQVKMLKDDYDYWPESEKREVINTIELFAGLLERVRPGCSCSQGRTCAQCELKSEIAAALRRYRGE